MVRQYRYSIVVPVFNEEKVLNEFRKRLTAGMDKLGENYEIVFVSDGSTDNSLEIMKKMNSHDERVKIIDFSRNFGHQMAITAGLDYASGGGYYSLGRCSAYMFRSAGRVCWPSRRRSTEATSLYR